MNVVRLDCYIMIFLSARYGMIIYCTHSHFVEYYHYMYDIGSIEILKERVTITSKSNLILTNMQITQRNGYSAYMHTIWFHMIT